MSSASAEGYPAKATALRVTRFGPLQKSRDIGRPLPGALMDKIDRNLFGFDIDENAS